MIDWDRLVVGPCMRVFGDADATGAGTITFMPATGPDLTITAVFTEHAKRQAGKDGAPDEVEELTTLGCQESQFGGAPPEVDDQFLIRGRLWRAAEVVPDGHGHILVHIMLADDSQANIPLNPAYG